MYSMHNEGNSVVVVRFIRTFANLQIHDFNFYKMYIDKLGDIVNKYNNTYHSTIKMKPADVKPSLYIDFNKKIINKILNLKLVTMFEYQHIKIFLQNVTFQIGMKKCL